mgnify:CR=1 FL=1
MAHKCGPFFLFCSKIWRIELVRLGHELAPFIHPLADRYSGRVCHITSHQPADDS